MRLGSTNDILEKCDIHTEIFDLKGRCLLPGFNDSHMHLMLYGLLYDQFKLRGLASIDEIISAGRAFIEKEDKKAGEWVVGFGFDQNLFSKKTFPLMEDIDKSIIHFHQY